MSMPTIDSSSAAVATTGTSFDVPYPGTVSNGNMLIMGIGTDSNNNGVVTPTDWVFVAEFINSTNQCVLAVYKKIADGTETGSLTVSIGNSPRVKIGRMVRSPNADSLQLMSTRGEYSKNVLHTSISTVGIDRLNMQWTGLNDDKAASSFDGESGGDLTLLFNDLSTLDNDFSLSLQTAPMASAGTLAGGSWSFSGPTRAWATIGFAIFDGVANPDPDPPEFTPQFSGLILPGHF